MKRASAASGTASSFPLVENSGGRGGGKAKISTTERPLRLPHLRFTSASAKVCLCLQRRVKPPRFCDQIAMFCRFHALKLIGALLWTQLALSGVASEKREWVKLADCSYVAGRYNDGDSFRVRSGTNEFILRLYFVDAPETNLRYPERTREQSEYFGA